MDQGNEGDNILEDYLDAAFEESGREEVQREEQ